MSSAAPVQKRLRGVSALERVLHRTTITDTCWLWTGHTHQGYGVLNHEGRSFKAHRVTYEAIVGPIPEGLVIDHLCRVRNCVNPDHLEPVTLLENVRRGSRATATHCKRGHEYTPENTHFKLDGSRACRRCRAENSQAWRQRRGSLVHHRPSAPNIAPTEADTATWIAEQVEAQRRARGWSQRDLAHVLGMGQATVARWENATRQPTLGMVVRLSRLFGVSVDELLTVDPRS